MGQDPINLSYNIGPDCVAGATLFAPGDTPKRLLLTTTGITPCPGTPGQAPPAAVVLVQQPPPDECRWILNTASFGFGIIAGAEFVVSIGRVGPPPGFIFGGGGPANNIPNGLICNILTPIIQASGGIAIVSWGPDI